MFLQFTLERHSKFSNFVEIGTGAGVSSILFGLPAIMRDGGSLYTFDIVDVRLPSALRAWSALPIFFEKADLDADLPWEPAMVATRKADLLFVDGGNRLLESLRYGSQLRQGGGLLIHDWLGYFGSNEDETKGMLRDVGFVEQYSDFSEHVGSAARFFIRMEVT